MQNAVVPKGGDPRAHGFNYGAGWGSDPKPAIYEEAKLLAQRLRKIATAASDDAWAVDHALWRVRIADTPEEKKRAVAELEAAVIKHQVIGIST